MKKQMEKLMKKYDLSKLTLVRYDTIMEDLIDHTPTKELNQLYQDMARHYIAPMNRRYLEEIIGEPIGYFKGFSWCYDDGNYSVYGTFGQRGMTGRSFKLDCGKLP